MAANTIIKPVRCNRKLKSKKGLDVVCNRFLVEVVIDNPTGLFSQVKLTCPNCKRRHIISVQGLGRMNVFSLDDGDCTPGTHEKEKEAVNA